jgi:hypothetical protein
VSKLPDAAVVREQRAKKCAQTARLLFSSTTSGRVALTRSRGGPSSRHWGQEELQRAVVDTRLSSRF